MKKAAYLALFLLITLVSSAQAADIKALLAQASQHVEQGQAIEAAAALRQALVEIWALKPMSIKGAVLVEKAATGYGQYQPRENNSYKPGEPILIYVEPAGYRFAHQGEAYTFGFSADFAILSNDGKLLAGQRGFGNWEFGAREPLFEVFVNLTYNLTGAPAGEYFLETTLIDANGNGQVSFKLPVVIQ